MKKGLVTPRVTLGLEHPRTEVERWTKRKKEEEKQQSKKRGKRNKIFEL